MRITYDREVDALYIRFKETTVTTQHLAEGIAADYDSHGRLAGIEILDAMERFGDPDVFRQVILEGLLQHRSPEGFEQGCLGRIHRLLVIPIHQQLAHIFRMGILQWDLHQERHQIFGV